MFGHVSASCCVFVPVCYCVDEWRHLINWTIAAPSLKNSDTHTHNNARNGTQHTQQQKYTHAHRKQHTLKNTTHKPTKVICRHMVSHTQTPTTQTHTEKTHNYKSTHTTTRTRNHSTTQLLRFVNFHFIASPLGSVLFLFTFYSSLHQKDPVWCLRTIFVFFDVVCSFVSCSGPAALLS